MKLILFLLLGCLTPWWALGFSIVHEEFVNAVRPTLTCHASTILEVSPGKLLVAWAGGTSESAPDSSIWISHYDGTAWSVPFSIATGNGIACWNPVLTKLPSNELILFYKIGKHPSSWKGFLKRSEDGGVTWSIAQPLPEGYLGPIKNKPWLRDDGVLLCGSSDESVIPNRVLVETTVGRGINWSSSGFIPMDLPEEMGIIQPAFFKDIQGRLHMLCRPRHGLRVLCSSVSDDGGLTWSPATLTNIPNPNAGIDTTTLHDGRSVLIYNDMAQKRTHLDLAVSDDGDNWRHVMVLDETTPGHEGANEVSYPAVIQTQDGLLHVTYTWYRLKIKHIVLDLNPAGYLSRWLSESDNRPI